MKESEFQTRLRDRLEKSGHLVFVTKRKTERRKFQDGNPDLIVCTKDGRFVGLELKTETGTVRLSQANMQRRFDARGLSENYWIIRPSDVDPLFKALKL